MLSNRYFYVDYGLKRFYTLTVVACLYALYNTFTPFNGLTIAFYLLTLVAILGLYRKTIVWSVCYGCGLLNKKRGIPNGGQK